MRLVGTGDLVITDLRATTAEIVLDQSVEGRLFAWDVRRALVVEVHKARGKRLVLALPPGAYRLELARDARFFSASVSTAAGQPRVISAQHFEEAAREATLARGVVEKFERRPFAASLIPPFATNPTPRARPVLNHLSLILLYDDPDAIEGLALALIGSGARRYASGVQLALLFNLTTELKGLQLAGAVNAVRAFGFGAQLAFGANYVGAAHDGIQAATAGNHAHTLRGAQLGMGLNLAVERAHGLQLGSVNWARTLQGAQGGFVNLARVPPSCTVNALGKKPIAATDCRTNPPLVVSQAMAGACTGSPSSRAVAIVELASGGVASAWPEGGGSELGG